MENVTMLDLRRNTRRIIMKARKGERMILSYRGKPVIRLEPFIEKIPEGDDPFFSLPEFSLEESEILNNKEMDALIYEK